jgi:hypothetical protein
MASESGLKSRILEMVRTTKEQKEPLLAGSEYVLTKQTIQSYEESIKCSQEQIMQYEEQLRDFNALNHHCRLVGAGQKVKGYALVIPVHDDYDMGKELETAILSLQQTHNLQQYLDDPECHGKFRLYPYEVAELSLMFGEFFTYDLVDDLAKMKKGFEASYGRQQYSQTIDRLNLCISWESNHAMTKGNEELAERLKESDTTLLVSMAAGSEQPSEVKKPKPITGPTRDEVEKALQQLAQQDLEIRTPSEIPETEAIKDNSATIDCVNVPRRIRKKRIKDRTRAKAEPKVMA